MTTHISARLAWHMDGWNGKVCSNPRENSYCIGQHSYPGEMIYEKRDLAEELKNSGKSFSDFKEIRKIPPCMYSANAFGLDSYIAHSDAPEFFKEPGYKQWEVPPATISIWPYEEMYNDEVKTNKGTVDYKKRRDSAENYFLKIENNKSLIIYYANYSNPFSNDEEKKYVIVGISRIQKVHPMLEYEKISQATIDKYGGFVWQRIVTSNYPEEGFCIPYHKYLDNEDVLEQIVCYPTNPNNFKYASRHIDDDDTLEIVENLIVVVKRLIELEDTTDNWNIRLKWLYEVITELWKNRGCYPGIPEILKLLDFQECIPLYKKETISGKEKEFKDILFNFLEKDIKIPSLELSEARKEKVLDTWWDFSDDGRNLLQDIFPRFSISREHLELILSEDRVDNGILSSLEEIKANPYLLAEEFVGITKEDRISFYKIDHGMFPAPELGLPFFFERTDPKERFRSIFVTYLQRQNTHTYFLLSNVSENVNRILESFSDWKKVSFNINRIGRHKDFFDKKLFIRESDDNQKYIYLKSVYDKERSIEKEIKNICQASDIKLKSPMTSKHWKDFIFEPTSDLAKLSPKEYNDLIQDQVDTCEKVFTKRICVITGSAGTGKTTVIKSLIKAIEKVDGAGTPFKLLAPTGKAAERIRTITGKSDASTIHSFLAERGWLNDNMTFKESGGTVEQSYRIYIIDEVSMIDLELMAALFRAIQWNTIQRIIFIGDVNQLPPIGIGKIFSDIINYLRENHPESLGVLRSNLRQVENKIKNKGTSILGLANVYINVKDTQSKEEKLDEEEILKKVQEGGDVDKDLRIVFWKDSEDLKKSLIDTINEHMELDTGKKLSTEAPYELWAKAFSDRTNPDYMQVLAPYKGGEFGIVNINQVLQEFVGSKMIKKPGRLGGITVFDKVIQYRNRPKSNPIWGYNFETGRNESFQINNGELGFVFPHGYDKDTWYKTNFWFERFGVKFSKRNQVNILYGKKLGQTPEKKNLHVEKPEDNLELAYAISVHKSQGSEFERVYMILPKKQTSFLSKELFYTAITRAKRHFTLFIEEDISSLLMLKRKEKSIINTINSSTFEFKPIPEGLIQFYKNLDQYKIYSTLADSLVRSKSEVIIANILFDREITFEYEKPLFAKDGSFYIPDFTINWRGEEFYLEHLGMLDNENYKKKWEVKEKWYNKHFPNQLIKSYESNDLSNDILKIIDSYFK